MKTYYIILVLAITFILFCIFKLGEPFTFQYADPNDYIGWRVMDKNIFSEKAVLYKNGEYKTVFFPNDYIMYMEEREIKGIPSQTQ